MGLEGTTGSANFDDQTDDKQPTDKDISAVDNEVKPAGSISKDQLGLKFVEQNIDELFTDQFDEAYAAVRVDKHIETLRLKSSRFANWIARLYYMNTKHVLCTDNIKNIKSVLEARAVFDGETRKLHLRVGIFTDQKDNDAIYYDLANKDWAVIKINERGWQLVNTPILFRRYSSTGTQVIPSKEYPEDIFDQFIDLINVTGDQQKLLLKCYIISLFFPDMPKPIQMLYGEQGAAKTSEQEAIKDLVDPSPIPTLTFPRDINELVQKMMHNYVCFFDNISFIPPWISDQFCRAVTGSSFTKRELYTDDSDIIYNFKRCLGFNGINLAATKADLLDRGIITALERIPESKRLKDTVVKERFAAIKPNLLGYIFDIIAKVIQVKKSGGIDIKEYPRMADFAEIGEIISRCMGYQENEFLAAYHKNINMLTDEAIEAHPVAIAIVRFMKDKSDWAGTITQLYQELIATAYDSRIDTFGRMWPKSASILSRRINEVKTVLRSKGITVESYLADTTTGLRGIKICKVQSEPSVPSEDQLSSQNSDGNSDGTLTPLVVQSEISKMPSESSQKNHEGISSDIPTSDGTYDTYDIVHTKDSLPSPSNGKREGLYWSGSKWYCEYCNANGDTFYMEVHNCNKSQMKKILNSADQSISI